MWNTNLCVCVCVCSPWYIRTGWLSVKHQFTYVCVCVCACVCMHACVCVCEHAHILHICLNPCWCVHYVLAFVKLWITVSISMYIMCVMFLQQDRHFTNFHYYWVNKTKYISCKLIFKRGKPFSPPLTFKTGPVTLKWIMVTGMTVYSLKCHCQAEFEWNLSQEHLGKYQHLGYK